MLSSARGHVWTIAPRLSTMLRGEPKAPPFTRYTTTLHEPTGDIVLSGKLSAVPGADTLAVVLHGCGGTPDADYCVRMAQSLVRHGVSALRLAWRGSDLAGEDFYHAGQTADLHAVLADPNLAGYRRIWLIAYSLGGNAALKFAQESGDTRLTAVATVCPVIDLPKANVAIDAPSRFVYRRYTLLGLAETYAAASRRGRAPTPLSEVRRATTFRAFDSLTVVPRYGFRDVDHYYQSQSASNALPHIARPTLIVSARHDPMIPWRLADDMRRQMSRAVTFRWAESGGHVFFPADLMLGERASRGLGPQLIAWLERQG